MKITAHFDPIRKYIIAKLLNAEQSIDIAVCWFTNDKLFDIVCKKLEEGLKVRCIILDDYINASPFGCDFKTFLEKGGQLHLSSVDNPMHNKYCIIDDSILINGSYNWTYFAESRNEENINIIEESPELIQSYMKDFQRLLSIYPAVETFVQNSLLEFTKVKYENTDRNAFSVMNLLSQDLFQRAIDNNDEKYYKAAKRINPDEIKFQTQAINRKWEKKRTLNITLSEKVVGNNIRRIFEKGTELPAQNEIEYFTVKDNQKSMEITVLKGENEIASSNKSITKYAIDKIPPLPKGEAKIKTEYRLTIDGVLHIKKHIHNTGLTDIKRVYLT